MTKVFESLPRPGVSPTAPPPQFNLEKVALESPCAAALAIKTRADAERSAAAPEIFNTTADLTASGRISAEAANAITFIKTRHLSASRRLDPESWQHTQRAVAVMLRELDTIAGPEAAEISSALLRINFRDRNVHALLAGRVVGRLHEFEGHEKQLVSLLWDYSEANVRNFSFLHRVARYVTQNPDAFHGKWCSTMAAAAANLQFHAPEFMAVCALKLHRDDCLKDQKVARRVRSSFSSIDVSDPEFLSTLAGEPVKSIDQCSPEIRSRLIGILSVLGLRQNKATDAIAERELSELPAKNGSQIARSAALHQELGTTCFEFYKLAQNLLVEKKADLSFSDWATAAEAFTHRPEYHPDFWNTCVTEAIRKAGRGSVKDFTRLVCACSQAGYYDEDLMRIAAVRFTSGQDDAGRFSCGLKLLNNEQLAAVAVAFARFKHYDSQLFSLLGQILRERGADLLSRQIVDVAWACAAVQHQDKEFNDWLFRQARKDSYQVSLSGICQLAWSAAALEPSGADGLYGHFLSRVSENGFRVSPGALSQLYQASAALGIKLPSETEDLLRDATRQNCRRSTHVNGFEREVAKVLSWFDIKCEPQAPRQGEHGYFIDFLITNGARKIALECDGDRFHQLKGDGAGRLCGSDVVRDRALSNLGYEVIHLSDSEWDSCQNKPRALAEKLGLAGGAAGA